MDLELITVGQRVLSLEIDETRFIPTPTRGSTMDGVVPAAAPSVETPPVGGRHSAAQSSSLLHPNMVAALESGHNGRAAPESQSHPVQEKIISWAALGSPPQIATAEAAAGIRQPCVQCRKVHPADQ